MSDAALRYLDERRVMMQVWADMVDEIGKVAANTSLEFVKALTFQPVRAQTVETS